MRCLAINTAGKFLSIGLVDNDRLLHSFIAPERKDQGNTVVSNINNALLGCGINYSDIDILAAVTGPGSFTGIRIGIAAVRGIAMSVKKPVVGITSFELYSKVGVKNIVAIESWREELYYSVLSEDGLELCPALNLKPEDFKAYLNSNAIEGKFVISGDAAETLRPYFPEAEFVIEDKTSEDVAKLAIAKFNKSNGDIEKPKPYYLRPADITISHKPQRTIEK